MSVLHGDQLEHEGLAMVVSELNWSRFGQSRRDHLVCLLSLPEVGLTLVVEGQLVMKRNCVVVG